MNLNCTPYILGPIPFIKTVPKTVATECYACKNYSQSPYLKCAVNPAWTIEQDCPEFELKASNWDSSEDKPSNYSQN